MDNPMLILVGGGIFAVVLLVVGVVITSREQNSLVDKRLKYLDEDKALRKGQKSAPLTDWLNKTTEKSSWGEGLAKELARADLKFKVGEYLALFAISSAALAIVFYIIGHQSVIFALIGAVIGLFVPRIWVRMQQGKRLTHFNDQLSDMLNLMVNSLRAGYSTMQAMEAVSKELPSPINDEFRRVVQEMQLGVSMEMALDNLLRRIPSADLDLVITAINVQREVGGNLAEILDTISHTIRERVRIKGEIRVLTSQQVYSGRFLSIMPIILMGALYVMNRDYMMLFFAEDTKIIGYIALGVAAILVFSGYMVMNKIANIEV
jgi:tight adherence protein B